MPSTSLNRWSPHLASFSSSPRGCCTRLRPTVGGSPKLHWPPSSPATPSIREWWPLVHHIFRPLIRPVFADGGRIKGHFLAFLDCSFFLSSSTSESDGQLSSPETCPSLRVPLLVRLLLVLLSQYLPSRVFVPIRYWLVLWPVTVLQGPCQLYVLRESAGLALFRLSDSSLVGLRPFSLPLFHLSRALCVVFVALSCLLRYWLGFYLNWQLISTVSLLFTFKQLHLVHQHMLQANNHQDQPAEHPRRK